MSATPPQASEHHDPLALAEAPPSRADEARQLRREAAALVDRLDNLMTRLETRPTQARPDGV